MARKVDLALEIYTIAFIRDKVFVCRVLCPVLKLRVLNRLGSNVS